MDVDALTAHLPAPRYRGAWGSADTSGSFGPAPAYVDKSHSSFPPPNYTELRDTSFHFRWLRSLNERGAAMPGGSLDATLKRVRSLLVWLASVAKVTGLFRLRYRVRQGQRLQRVFREHMLWRDQALWSALALWGSAEDQFRRNSGIGSHGQSLDRPGPDAAPPPAPPGEAGPCTCDLLQGLAEFRFGGDAPSLSMSQSLARSLSWSRASQPRPPLFAGLPPTAPALPPVAPAQRCAHCRQASAAPPRRLSGVAPATDGLPQILPNGGGPRHSADQRRGSSHRSAPSQPPQTPSGTTFITSPGELGQSWSKRGRPHSPEESSRGPARRGSGAPAPLIHGSPPAALGLPAGRRPSQGASVKAPCPPKSPLSARPPSPDSDEAVMLWELFRGRTVPLRAKWLVARELYALRRRHLRDSLRNQKWVAGSPHIVAPPPAALRPPEVGQCVGPLLLGPRLQQALLAGLPQWPAARRSGRRGPRPRARPPVPPAG